MRRILIIVAIQRITVGIVQREKTEGRSRAAFAHHFGRVVIATLERIA